MASSTKALKDVSFVATNRKGDSRTVTGDEIHGQCPYCSKQSSHRFVDSRGVVSYPCADCASAIETDGETFIYPENKKAFFQNRRNQLKDKQS